MFEREGSLSFAAEMYLHAGKEREAARVFERAGNTDKAVEIYRRVGDPGQVVTLLAKDGQFLDAAKELLKLPNFNVGQALTLLNQAEPVGSEYRETAYLLSRHLAGQGQIDTAISLLQGAVRGEGFGPDTIELFYTLAFLFGLQVA